ncbi:hypothetical protein NXS19_007502 [Fusarium pseudograminearum]|nr:hypothetical protein NXS19_007502 [Fusarium pseudograminearum]
MADAEMGGHAGRASAVPEFGYSTSDTDTSEDEDSLSREGSDTTVSWSSDSEGDKASAGSDKFPASKKGEKRSDLKRKSSWTAIHTRKRRVGFSVIKSQSPKFKPKKDTDYRKRREESWGWRKMLLGLSGA